jgi:uncharacterized protein YndB with AHSA1/START domain
MTEDASVAMHPTALSVRKSITVQAPIDKCFETFTTGIDSWWPRQHHVGDSPMKEMIMEPKVGGRCYAIREDGTESPWGHVLVWEPPTRLVASWELLADFSYDESFVTEVEVTFTSQGPDQTLVELEHRNLERYAEAKEQMVAMLGSDDGWGLSLANFAASAEGRPVPGRSEKT